MSDNLPAGVLPVITPEIECSKRDACMVHLMLNLAEALERRVQGYRLDLRRIKESDDD